MDGEFDSPPSPQMKRVVIESDGDKYNLCYCMGKCDGCHLRFICMSTREDVITITKEFFDEIQKSRGKNGYRGFRRNFINVQNKQT